MSLNFDLPRSQLLDQVAAHPYPLVFATLSGSHLYGFPSANSDFDLRGVHILPWNEIVGLKTGNETIEKSGIHSGLEMDLVTHDAKKFFLLLLRNNGYVLEQVLSPIVLHTSEFHHRLKAIALKCVTRHHAHHYLGFASTQWQLFRKQASTAESGPHVKPLLYVFRVLLTGIHLMRTGELEANLTQLSDHFKLGYLPELIEAKIGGSEKEILHNCDLQFFESQFESLMGQLKDAHQQSKLPESPTGNEDLNQLLLDIRRSPESLLA